MNALPAAPVVAGRGRGSLAAPHTATAARLALPTRLPSAGVPAYLAPRRLRVGFVVHVMQVAGAEVLIRELIHRLRSRIEPTVFCLDALGQIGEELHAGGTSVVCLHRKPGRDLRLATRLAAEIRSRGVQIVHAHQYTPFFYAALAKMRTLGAFRLILTEHGRHYPDTVSPLRRAINRLALGHCADAINACSRYSADALSRVDGFRGRGIRVIENGIDLSRYPPRADRATIWARLQMQPDRRYVLAVARFHPVKDHATLLRMFAAVALRRPDVDLLLAGDGPLRGDLEQLTVRLGLAARVRFLGVRGDIPELLTAADVFALTSVSEAASLTLLEAMACGKPIVATNVGGNPELVRTDVDALLFPRGDAECGATMLLRIIDDPGLAARLGTSAQERARQHFSLARTVEQYDALYRRLVGRGGSV